MINKQQISKTLFSIYPLFYNFENYSQGKIEYISDSNSVKINNVLVKNILTSSGILDLIKINSEKVEISQEYKKTNEIFKFHNFITNFTNIIVYQYKELKDLFKIIYNIYNQYILQKDKSVVKFINSYKNSTSDSDIIVIITEIYGFATNLSTFEDIRKVITNYIISNQSLLNKSLYSYEDSIIPSYIFNDFIAYLEIIEQDLSYELEEFIKSFTKQIKIYNKSNTILKKVSFINLVLSKQIKDKLKGYNIKDLQEKQDVKTIYEKARIFISNYIDSTKTDESRYEKVKALSKKDKNSLKINLGKFYYLLDSNKGSWKEDIGIDSDFKEPLRQLQFDYVNILQIIDYNIVEVKSDYIELAKLYEKIKELSIALKNKKRITQEDYDIINNFDFAIKNIESNPKYEGDTNLQQEINKVKNLYSTLSSPEYNSIISKNNIEATEIIRKDTIYFDTNINIFKLILKYMIMFAVFLILFIVILSFVSILILLYDIIMYIINLFINPNLTKALTIDYLTKNIIYCRIDNYSEDRYLLFSVQNQNLGVFTLSAYIFYLLLALLIFYLMHVLYASVNKKILKGSIYDIDKEGSVLIIFVIIFIYSIIHLFLYKFVFKPLVYIPYKNYNIQEENVDKLLEDIILIKTLVSSSNEIIVDNDFFNILFDLTRIDELNTIFLNGIKDNNASGCLEQKIIIYDLYIYLKEHISFDNKRQQEFKEYCTSTVANKPINPDTNKKVTFISLLNNSEVRMIQKYHEELEFYNNIPNENIEYYNILNKKINNKLKNINENIITYNKTLVPFFITIIYIFGIFLFTFGLFYMVIYFILMGDSKLSDKNKFIYYFVYILYTIKLNIYDKIIKWL